MLGFGFIITVVLCFSGPFHDLVWVMEYCHIFAYVIPHNLFKIATHLAFYPKVISENVSKTKNAKIKHNITP